MRLGSNIILIPPRAAKRDDVLRAVKQMYSPKKVGIILDEVLLSALRTGEWFDFGELDDTEGFVTNLANDGTAFAKVHLVNLPFPTTVFRARITLHVKNMDDKPFTSEFIQILIQENVGKPIEILSMMVIGWNYDKSLLMLHGKMVGNLLSTSDLGSNEGACKVEGQMFLAMWLMLNTKGIHKIVTEPDSKLNKARIKTGKLPLLRNTYISANHYIEALRETVRSDNSGRASPRMHLRRAHLRHLGLDKIVPVHAAIINGAGGLDRDKYVVRP